MIDDDAFEQRLAELKAQTADMHLSRPFYDSTQKIMNAALSRYDDYDPSLMDAPTEDFQALVSKINAPQQSSASEVSLTLSHLDVFEIEKTCLVTQGFFDQLGGEKVFGVTAQSLRAIADGFEDLRRKHFPDERKAAS